ncbi:MAG: ATP-binding protein [Polaromonas sp.]
MKLARTRSLRTTLNWLVAACMLPVTLMSVAFSVSHYQSERTRLVVKSTNAARVLMEVVDNEFRTIDVALQALASSPALVTRDYAAFYGQAHDVLRRGFSESIVLVDSTGQQLMNTAVPPSKPLPRIPDDALVKTLNDVLASGKTAVSSLFLGPALKKPLAMVTVPMMPPTVVAAGSAPAGPPFVLAGVKLPSKIQAILVNQKLPADWTVSVIDGSGALVARSSDIEQLLGRPVTPDLAKLLQLRTEAVSEGVSRDGKPILLVVTRSRFSDWSVAVGIPLDSLKAELRRPFWWVLGVTVSIVLLSLVLAWVMGGRVARTIQTLRASAVALGNGQEVVVPPLSFREANDVGDAITKASLTIVSTSASLRDSETRMRGILASAKDAIITFDDQQTVLIFNTAAAVMFECNEADALGAPVTAFIPERFHDRHHEYIRTYRATGEAFGKAVGLRRSGLEFPVEISYSNVEQPSGTLHTLIIRDITARLANVEALKRSNHDLQQFAYVASHDLKTPLRSISGFIQLLERKYAPSFEEGAQSLINRTRDATRRLEQLTDDLLAYARVNSDMTPFAVVDLNDVATEVTHLLDAVITETGARVTVASLPSVRGARTQLVQLLLNLIGNALKYCKNRSPVIRVSALRQGSDWVVSVEDNGIGIEEKHYERIFEVFKRLHGQNEYAGTGIGLAVCRRVVHHHGGKIWVSSVAGQGSTFYFTIPTIHQEGTQA